MPKRHARETILARWHIDASLWREFAATKPAGFITLTPPPEFPAQGIEVVIRDDAIFVGKTRVRGLLPHRGVSVHDGWLEVFMPCDEGDCINYLLPIPRPALPQVTRVVDGFIAADREARRLEDEEDARPTLPNRFGRWVNSHPAVAWMGRNFVVVALVLFFVVIPLGVFCLYRLSVVFHWE